MQEKFTIFNSVKNKDKRPISPYGDKTFVFRTYTAENNLQMYTEMVRHFILNIPLTKIDEDIRSFRRIENLKLFFPDDITYMVVDFDHVHSEENKDEILEYFKDYKCIIGESTSYNGKDCFNMKGVLFTDPIPIQDAKIVASELAHELQEYCKFDEAVVRRATFNAPISKNKVFLNNENGERFKFNKTQAMEHINAIKSEYLDSKVKEIKDIHQELKGDTIEELCVNVFKSMGYEAMQPNTNGSVQFKHPNEKTVGGYFWFSTSPYTMHHPNSTKTINIFDIIRKSEVGKVLLKKEIDYSDSLLKFDTNTNILEVQEKYLTIDESKIEMIDKFINKRNGLFSIKSPMGTGKSTVINHIIEQAYQVDMRVLIITNRISVAQDFAKKYKGLKLYNVDKYNIGDSLVCQYDSLWKYNIKFFDMVIMDEFISLMTHSRSGLNNSSINIAKFFGCFNKKLVIADAFLTGYENFLLNHKVENLHQINNTWRDTTTLYNYLDVNKFIDGLLYNTINCNNKATVSSTSLRFLEGIRYLLEKRGKKCILLTAQTPDVTKQLIYGLFEKSEHDKWDVLLYSPTLTVGVSNLNNFYHHYHHDTSMSTDVISSIQMIKRTRKATEIHMFIKERTNYLKTTYNDVRDEYMGNIGRNIEQNYLFDVDNYGEAKLSNIGKKAIKIDVFKNILEFDHKKAMFWMMKYHFMHEPRIIESRTDHSAISGVYKLLAYDKQAKMSSDIQQFLELTDIEKMDILAGGENTLQILAEVEDSIKSETNNKIKEEIIEMTLKDKSFISKCNYYRSVYNYSSKIWDMNDIKNVISKAVINNNNDDLVYHNNLLKIQIKGIFTEYYPKIINGDKLLKYLLDKAGYKIRDTEYAGQRLYSIDKDVQKYYGYMK